MADTDTLQDEYAFAERLARAQDGSPGAFDDLVRWLERPLLSFLRGRRVEDPHGVANDVLVRVFRRIDTFSGTEPEFRAWVFRITRNLIVDASRQQARRVTEYATAPADLPPVAVESDGWLDRIDEGPRIERLLAELSDDQRDVVLLRIVAECSVAETAEIMGRQPGSIRVLQHRALDKLRTKTSSML